MIPSAVQYLIEGGHQAPSADNSQPWSFTWDGTSLSVSYSSSGPATKVFGKAGHAERLTMGGVVENIVQLADAIGMAGTWELGPDDARYLRFTPNTWPEETRLDPQHPVFRRHTNRFRFRAESLPREVSTSLKNLNEQDCRIVVLDEQPQIAELATLVRRASSMRFRNRTLHEWFGETLRFTQAEVDQGTGLDVATIELPPGGKALLRLIMDWRRMSRLNGLGMYRLLSGIESQAIAKSPALLAVLGPSDAAFAAGRLMERAWLLLTQQGVAAQPYYVVSDQLVRVDGDLLPDDLVGEGGALKTDTQAFFGDNLFPHMLLRVGYEKTEVTRSRRLPLQNVTKDDSALQVFFGLNTGNSRILIARKPLYTR